VKQQYKEYLRLNKNILLGFSASIVISAIVAQLLSNQQSYVNTTITLVVDYVVYFTTFGTLFYVDNKKKYMLESGEVDRASLKRDLIKIISSLGIGEVIYTIARWSLQYYLLTDSYEAYIASLVSQSISTCIYMVTINLSVKLMRLYKDD
jgi:small-conductance mechanosensitive channel